MLRKHSKKTTGFSLLELLLAIAIIGLIILMATRYFATVRSGQQVSAGVQEIQGIRSAINTQIAQGVASIGAATICPTLPNGFCNGTTNFIYPWDSGTGNAGSVIAVPSATTGANFDITMAGIPDSSICNNVKNAFTKELVTGFTPTCTASGSTYSLTLAFVQ